jgi:hypothetical protein
VKGLRVVRGLRQQFNDDDRTRVAEVIREHLALAGWRIEPGPGIGGHSQFAWPADRRGHARWGFLTILRRRCRHHPISIAVMTIISTERLVCPFVEVVKFRQFLRSL